MSKRSTKLPYSARFFIVLFSIPLLLIMELNLVTATWATCETIDGDCGQDCCRITAHLPLSGEPNLVQTAIEAQAVMNDIANWSSTEISFDDPKTGLHSSLFYFCCHSDDEIVIMREALIRMEWSSFTVDFNNVACNLDHDGETIYLHALPDDQTRLFGLARKIETAIQAAGVPIHHPRKSMFHMTLARVNYSYPVDYAMAELDGKQFGRILLCSFLFDGVQVRALDYHDCMAGQESGGRL